MWVFGYGSLIWKANFPYVEKKPCYIKGYVRRFWQGSHDHRGTLENPGRVVTLIKIDDEINNKESRTIDIKCLNSREINDQIHNSTNIMVKEKDHRVYGMAYKLCSTKKSKVLEDLNYREKNGYTVHQVEIFDSQNDEIITNDALVYIALPENEAYLGISSPKEIAQTIKTAEGLSGHNIEYFINLEKSIREIHPKGYEDEHLIEIKQEIDLILENNNVNEIYN